ncbi:GMC oxidoreductase [Paraburkholderia sp. WSM4179]|uniref:GMC oxidoreductase n=1 Tax=unclassified Paraburkholderia TaxID=2615204 RepID=UPI001EF9266E|nr:MULTISPECIES: GMC oxidoreductase [Paraburkholderia]
MDWDLLLMAVHRHISERWVAMYIECWLKAPVQMPDGKVQFRTRGTPQGGMVTPWTQKVTLVGVISPLLSNIYLTEGDQMLERAKETTRNGTYTYVEYARFADDLVVLIYVHPRHAGLLGAVTRRLREEFAKLQVEINEEKSRTVRVTGAGKSRRRWISMSTWLPLPAVSKEDHVNDNALRNHAYAQVKMIYEACGSTRVMDLPPYPAGHNMGTNRMSEKFRDGVVNRWGQAHEVTNLFVPDGSQLTTSSAENPTLTIVALAIRQAEYIADAVRRRDI